jgi:hypothetical protein
MYLADYQYDDSGGTTNYGIIEDKAGFMRGAAADIPGNVASGPTGDPGSYLLRARSNRSSRISVAQAANLRYTDGRP